MRKRQAPGLSPRGRSDSASSTDSPRNREVVSSALNRLKDVAVGRTNKSLLVDETDDTAVGNKKTDSGVSRPSERDSSDRNKSESFRDVRSVGDRKEPSNPGDKKVESVKAPVGGADSKEDENDNKPRKTIVYPPNKSWLQNHLHNVNVPDHIQKEKKPEEKRLYIIPQVTKYCTMVQMV